MYYLFTCPKTKVLVCVDCESRSQAYQEAAKMFSQATGYLQLTSRAYIDEAFVLVFKTKARRDRAANVIEEGL